MSSRMELALRTLQRSLVLIPDVLINIIFLYSGSDLWLRGRKLYQRYSSIDLAASIVFYNEDVEDLDESATFVSPPVIAMMMEIQSALVRRDQSQSREHMQILDKLFVLRDGRVDVFDDLAFTLRESVALERVLENDLDPASGCLCEFKLWQDQDFHVSRDKWFALQLYRNKSSLHEAHSIRINTYTTRGTWLGSWSSPAYLVPPSQTGFNVRMTVSYPLVFVSHAPTNSIWVLRYDASAKADQEAELLSLQLVCVLTGDYRARHLYHWLCDESRSLLKLEADGRLADDVQGCYPTGGHIAIANLSASNQSPSGRLFLCSCEEEDRSLYIVDAQTGDLLSNLTCKESDEDEKSDNGDEKSDNFGRSEAAWIWEGEVFVIAGGKLHVYALDDLAHLRSWELSRYSSRIGWLGDKLVCFDSDGIEVFD